MPYRNHNKWDHLPINLTDQEAGNPLSVIHSYFEEESSFPSTIKDLNQLFCYAFANNCNLTCQLVVQLFDFQGSLNRLLEAANLLQKSCQIDKALVDKYDSLNPNSFCKDATSRYNIWDHHPRHLSLDEFENPQEVLEVFFMINSVPRWKDFLKDLFVAAVENAIVTTGDEKQNIWLNCTWLLKLIEALHLIHVRGARNIPKK